MNNFFKEHHQLVYQEWLPADEIKNLTVLDLGSQTGWLGKYCIENGAKEYIGVEIDKLWVDRSRESFPDLTFIQEDLEDYISNCVNESKFFDIVVITRTLEGVHNLITLLQNLSKITNLVVIETGVPINNAAFELLEILKSTELSDEQQQLIENIKHSIEYKQTFVEYVDDPNKFIWAVASTGFYNAVFERLGFQLCLETNERVKQKWPAEYGYVKRKPENNSIGKKILKFKKIADEQLPLTWKEWYDSDPEQKKGYPENT
jgi:hypothetical protein